MRITINNHKYYSMDYCKIPEKTKFIYFNQWDQTILRCTKTSKWGMRYKDPERPEWTFKRYSPMPTEWISMVSWVTLEKVGK